MKNKVKTFFYEFLYLSFLALLISLSINVFFKCSSYFISFSISLYSRRDLLSILILFLLAISSFLFLKSFIYQHKDLDSSGIVELEREIHHKNNVPHFIEIPLLYISSFITFFFGFPLGSEGPSVTLCGKLAALSNDLFSIDKDEENTNVALGAASGFAAAFLSPFVGVPYLFECVKYKFNLLNFIKIVYLNILILFFSSFLNRSPLIQFETISYLSIKECLLLLIIFIFILFLSIVFKVLVISINKFFEKRKSNNILANRALIYFVFIIIFNLFFFPFMYSGHSLINNLKSFGTLTLILILLIRIVLTPLFSSGKISGGVVIPTMCIGSLSGQIIINITNDLIHLNAGKCYFIILFSMILIFSLVNKAPFTSSFLFINTIILVNKSVKIFDASFIACIFLFFLGNIFFDIVKRKNLVEEMLTISK